MTRKCVALLPVVCSQAHSLTYASKCCTSEHCLGRGSQTETGLAAGWHSLQPSGSSSLFSQVTRVCYSFPQSQSSTFQFVTCQSRVQLLGGWGGCSQVRGCEPDSGLERWKELVRASAAEAAGRGLQWCCTWLQWTHQPCPAACCNWNMLCLHWQLQLRVKLKLILKLWNLLTGFVFPSSLWYWTLGLKSSTKKCCYS